MLWNLSLPAVLAQAAPDPTVTVSAATPPWWHALLDQAFALTILFIFLVAVVGLIVNQRRRDKCLKLFDGYRATVLDTSNQALWGTMCILPKGMEVVFDRPYTTRRGIDKSSALMYEAHQANVLAMLRLETGLPDPQQSRRRDQIQRTFRPNLARRIFRTLRNVLNTLRDAFAKAFTAVIGQLTRTGRAGALGQQQAGVDQIGQTLLAAAGNAYEPLLERHIGKPVVLQLKSPLAGDAPSIDIPGYLAEYSDKYVAVFNREQPIHVEKRLTLDAAVERPGVSIEVADLHFTVRSTGPELLIVRRICTDAGEVDVNAVLTQGSSIRFDHGGNATPAIDLATTRRVDMVCPRGLATVLFGGESADATKTGHEPHEGVAPEHVVESHSDNPVAGL
ncbi:MAG: hypothetical protein ACOC3G_07500 [Phycisphaeraceae bacterium]